MISQSPLEKKCYGSTVWELHCLRTALCESYQAKSEQNVRQDQIPRVRHVVKLSEILDDRGSTLNWPFIFKAILGHLVCLSV